MRGLSQILIKRSGMQQTTSEMDTDPTLLTMEDRLLFMDNVGNAVKNFFDDKHKRKQFIQELKSLY
jgi:hypothetical protein